MSLLILKQKGLCVVNNGCMRLTRKTCFDRLFAEYSRVVEK